jgi:hypothetical protein
MPTSTFATIFFRRQISSANQNNCNLLFGIVVFMAVARSMD